MTEQEQIAKVVEALQGVFDTNLSRKDGKGVTYSYLEIVLDSNGYQKAHYTHGRWNLWLTLAQHQAWIEKKLLAWLEHEERGYAFTRTRVSGWQWWHRTLSTWTAKHTLWYCLIAAFEHWQSQQKPEKVTKRDSCICTCVECTEWREQERQHNELKKLNNLREEISRFVYTQRPEWPIVEQVDITDAVVKVFEQYGRKLEDEHWQSQQKPEEKKL